MIYSNIKHKFDDSFLKILGDFKGDYFSHLLKSNQSLVFNFHEHYVRNRVSVISIYAQT